MGMTVMTLPYYCYCINLHIYTVVWFGSIVTIIFHVPFHLYSILVQIWCNNADCDGTQFIYYLSRILESTIYRSVVPWVDIYLSTRGTPREVLSGSKAWLVGYLHFFPPSIFHRDLYHFFKCLIIYSRYKKIVFPLRPTKSWAKALK